MSSHLHSTSDINFDPGFGSIFFILDEELTEDFVADGEISGYTGSIKC